VCVYNSALAALALFASFAMSEILKKVIFNIPICGGFCAPTRNREPCFRHVSNEYTLPLAPRFMKLAPLIESSACCLACGRVGATALGRRRKPIMLAAFALNLLAFIFTCLALVGTSKDPSSLRSIPWVKGSGVLLGLGANGATYDVYVGNSMRVDILRCSEDPSKGEACRAAALARGFTRPSTDPNLFQRNVAWDDEAACNFIGNATSLSASCQECKDNLLSHSSLILSLITQFPTMTTDLQRTTRFGDVNCQKTMGVLSNLVSFVTTIISLLAFRSACWSALPVESDFAHFQWSLGPGFRLLMAAAGIKIADAIAHSLVPTPPGKWQKPNKGLELADYMELGNSVKCVPDDSSADTSGSSSGPASTSSDSHHSDSSQAPEEKDTPPVPPDGSSPLPQQPNASSGGRPTGSNRFAAS